MKDQIWDETDSALSIIWAHALAPGQFRWRGTKDGAIIDAEGNTIGSYHPYPSGRGWSIHTRAYGGYASPDELEIVR